MGTSLNTSAEVYQGVLAGCTHAPTLLFVLTYRVIQRLSQMCENVTPHQLMDDATLHFVGPANDSAQSLQLAALYFTECAFGLGFLRISRVS